MHKGDPGTEWPHCWPPGVGSATCHNSSLRVPGLNQPEAGYCPLWPVSISVKTGSEASGLGAFLALTLALCVTCDICRWKKQVPLVSLPCRDRMGRTPATPKLRVRGEAREGLLRWQECQRTRASKGYQAKPGSLESVGIGSDYDPLPWRS